MDFIVIILLWNVNFVDSILIHYVEIIIFNINIIILQNQCQVCELKQEMTFISFIIFHQRNHCFYINLPIVLFATCYTYKHNAILCIQRSWDLLKKSIETFQYISLKKLFIFNIIDRYIIKRLHLYS